MQISPEIKEYLETAGFAILPVRFDLGRGEEVVLLVKATRDILAQLKKTGAKARTGWQVRQTAHGPVVCLLLGITGGEGCELLGESYLDPVDDSDFKLLTLLSNQKALKAALYDEEMELVWAVDALWNDLAQLAAEQAVDRAEELAQRAVQEGLELDFARACEAFGSEMPLERMREVLFTDTEI